MPLAFANIGEKNVVKKIGGNSETKKHLESLGFVTGTEVTVISSLCGNVIVNIMGTRIAISNEMAKKILI